MKIFQREASIIAVLLISLFSTATLAASACEESQTIESVSPDGTVIKLMDGSAWAIDAADAMIAVHWMPTTKISVCECKPINNDNDKTCKFTNHEDRKRIDAVLVK
ncbi:MAG: hypothetical protein DRR06_06340 [Gammaproteobacteria bacterium]|nr:MAG: hypothetical protein DRR06_06340 [Gammaproteobacteria bacterium]RLA47030.1 MAG: hypothetical protein DRR42_17890 [Gammaproteobacteria bacterium]